MVAEIITKTGIPADAELFFRVIVASVLGYMIGYERKNRDKSAGMRTHAIVALGAALMMVVSKYGFYDVEKVDSSRVAAQTLRFFFHNPEWCGFSWCRRDFCP